MAASYPIRPVTEDELPAFHEVFELAAGRVPQAKPALKQFLARFEVDRSLAAFDEGTVVGTAGVYSLRMRVPGALVPVAGVSACAVLPAYRRQGILTALMSRQLDDIRTRGEAVAALVASESGIYRRYGYGPAAWQTSYLVHRGEGAMAPTTVSDPELRLRGAEPREAREQLAKVYDLALAERPGFFDRGKVWWNTVLQEAGENRGPRNPMRCVVAEDSRGPRGYALFKARPAWDETNHLPESTLTISELVTADPAAAAALWADLLSRDLTAEFRASMRPLDDPLPHLLADPRRLRTVLSDGLWARLIDVGAALAQRRYSCPVDVVIEVTDEMCGHNEGRWRLSAGEAGSADGLEFTAGFGAVCERTTAPADLAVPAHVLGATYLGGTRLGWLARAGLVRESTPGAVARLSTALSWEPAPWCPRIF